MKHKIRILSVTILLTIFFVSSIQAADITGYGVTIDRHLNSGILSYSFCTDVWGSDIGAITVVSPSGNTYSLGYIPEEGQWGFDKDGGDHILSEFIDGIYIFNVTYTDSTNESLSVQLGGSFPPFPEFVSLDSINLTWEQWLNPIDPIGIEVGIESEGGAEISEWLSASATSYNIPSGFLQDDTIYDIEIMFLTSTNPNAHKNSELTINYHYNSVPIADAGLDQTVFESVNLDGSASSDPDGTIISWQWTLAHRTNTELDKTATGSNPRLTNLSPGFYDIVLTVTNNAGNIDKDSMLLGVAGRWDIDGDNKLGLSECIYILQILSGIKSDN